jgi:Skp family chaperone for outer membrane proteins
VAFAQTPPPAQTPKPAQTPPPAQTPKPTPVPALPVAPPSATPVPFPTESKVGFVDMQAIVSASKLGKSGQEKMKALQTQRDADLSAKSKQAQSLQQEIQAQASVLTPVVLAQKNSELDKLTRAGQFAQQDWDAQVDALNKQLLQDFQEKVLPILESLRSEMGLFAIFDAANSGALAIHPGLNLSTEVIKRLDAKYASAK